jgi:hypothetical protein
MCNTGSVCCSDTAIGSVLRSVKSGNGSVCEIVECEVCVTQR